MEERWSFAKKIKFTFLLFIFIISFPFIIFSGVSILLLVILSSVVVGVCVWWVVGWSSSLFIKFYLKIHSKLLGKISGAREVALIENQDLESSTSWDIFYRSLHDSLLPTVIALSLIGYIVRDAVNIMNSEVFLILHFSPIIVSFIIPLRIAIDSRLYHLYKETKEIISLGREINIRLKSIGGILALVLFIFTLYTMTESLRGTIIKLLVYFSHIYPTLVLTSFIYYKKGHQIFTKRATKAGVEEEKEKHLIRLMKR